MDVDQPPKPEDPDYTAAQHKRQRAESDSSTSPEGSIHSTRTLRSEDLEFISENGRIYGNETYFMPCDQPEQDRLAIQHQVFLLALKGQLSTTKITQNTRRILDLGTGPGNWAVAAAEAYPHAEVVGLDMAVWDLETTEETSGGGRVTWQIDDLDVWGVETDLDELASRLEQFDPFRDPTQREHADTLSIRARHRSESGPPTPSIEDLEIPFNPYELEAQSQPGWNFSERFDLIHMRNMKGTFGYWEEVYAEIYKNLLPGGWVEVADYELLLPMMLDSAEPSDEASGESSRVMARDYPFPVIRQLYLSMMQASFKAGRPLGTFYMHATYLEDAGFKDVRTTYVNVPVGCWPDDEEQKSIGKMFLVSLMEGLEAILLRLLTKHGDAEKKWTAEEVREQIDLGKKEILQWNEHDGRNDNAEGWCANFKWVVGRKSKNAPS